MLRLTNGVTLNLEGDVARTIPLSQKLNVGETRKIDFSYIVPLDVTLLGV